MVTKRGLTLVALVSTLLVSCASQTPNLRTYVIGYDLQTLKPKEFVNPYDNFRPINSPQPPLVELEYRF